MAPGASQVPPATSPPPAAGQAYAQLRPPQGTAGQLVYRPALLGSGRLHFVRTGVQVDHWEDRRLLYIANQDPDDRLWEQAQTLVQPLTTQPAAEPDAQLCSAAGQSDVG